MFSLSMSRPTTSRTATVGIASRVGSPMASRAHRLTVVIMLITSLPAAEPLEAFE
jgi:hypothetical protein